MADEFESKFQEIIKGLGVTVEVGPSIHDVLQTIFAMNEASSFLSVYTSQYIEQAVSPLPEKLLPVLSQIVKLAQALSSEMNFCECEDCIAEICGSCTPEAFCSECWDRLMTVNDFGM